MRTKIFVRNTIFSVVEQLFVALSGFIIPRLLINHYGSERNGLVTSIMQFFGYFKLVEAGLGTASIFALYKPLASGDIETTNRILYTAKKNYERSAILFLVGTIILSIIYPMVIETDTLDYMSIFALSFVLGLSGVIDFLVMAKYRVLLTADRKQYVLSISSIAYTISYILITYFALKLGFSLIALKSIVLTAVVGKAIILFSYSRHKYKIFF